MTTVLLIRHGETPWNQSNRLQGWAPISLSDAGREQARALGNEVAQRYDINRIHSSDLLRTLETAEIIAEYVPAPITSSSGWRERDFGIAQGLTYDELSEQLPEYSLRTAGADALDASPDSGESLLETQDRILGEWDELLAQSNANETILIVTHGGPICLLLGKIAGRELVSAFLDYSQHNCAINEIKITDDNPEIIRENHVPY